jgi:hypothetical protein
VVYTLLNHFKGILVTCFKCPDGDQYKELLFLRAGDTPSIRGGFTNPHQTSQLVQSKIIHKEKNSSLRG